MSEPREDETVPEYVARQMREHYTPKPDPLTVTGRLRWQEQHLMIGPIACGHVQPLYTEWLAAPNWGMLIATLHPTEAAARAALVQAVKEAIEG